MKCYMGHPLGRDPSLVAGYLKLSIFSMHHHFSLSWAKSFCICVILQLATVASDNVDDLNSELESLDSGMKKNPHRNDAGMLTPSVAMVTLQLSTILLYYVPQLLIKYN